MGFFDGFPFTNTHQLNLDWILAKLKSVESISDDAKAAIERANSAVNIAENAASNSQHYSEQAAGVVQTLYGVGSVYISTNHISPAIFFGGSWERIEGRFLVGASESYAAGATGGAASVAHRHDAPGGMGGGYGYFDIKNGSVNRGVSSGQGGAVSLSTTTITTVVRSYTSEETVDNMPPYLAVYMWKRVA